MILYRTSTGIVLEHDGKRIPLPHDDWDELINREDTRKRLSDEIATLPSSDARPESDDHDLLPPIGRQEVWAAGVTYYRSRSARMEESRDAGGGSFYDRVYEAERPELFPKAAPWRVVGHGGTIRIRRDARWSVPEVINSNAEIVGYTIGDDVSSRDIEGENPLYLPQAKSYDGSCALGPGVLLSGDPLPSTTSIELEILRGGAIAFQGDTALDQMRRTPDELVQYLYRELTFPHGCVLMTGTGIVPDDSFTLESGDEVRITIGSIGTPVMGPRPPTRSFVRAAPPPRPRAPLSRGCPSESPTRTAGNAPARSCERGGESVRGASRAVDRDRRASSGSPTPRPPPRPTWFPHHPDR